MNSPFTVNCIKAEVHHHPPAHFSKGRGKTYGTPSFLDMAIVDQELSNAVPPPTHTHTHLMF